MKMRACAVLSLLIASAAIPATTFAAPPPPTSPAHQANTSSEDETGRLLDWVAAQAPDYVPLGRDGSVRVEGDRLVYGRLPQDGEPGETYLVETTLPDGTTQSWTFRWTTPSARRAGGWEMTGYTFRKGDRPRGVS